uniref:Secreted protein n=1 Tax=Candidatus Kentrum eta TaxID=2126337 RepID=A0A450UYH6_9GAMM|nr:MAG: hypothetical protein BECKH772A_GA0070896_1001610 [Candidatus Kentron sp. H]VFJ92755.1 MAG: hypothetical protein BECKH772B_GA0070898_100339 [Candidatus Kentron sp. H]VFJ97588.1 MAG: hypothetical protein BECKH772C_GA0070978_100149 [Candidatus Kentron sp. H]
MKKTTVMLFATILIFSSLPTRANAETYWPHAINCGSEWDALFILHANPIGDSTDLAYYVQVYPNEYRYVRFNADGSYYDRAGHDGSSVGCQSKPVTQLQEEDRTFYFMDEVPVNSRP